MLGYPTELQGGDHLFHLSHLKVFDSSKSKLWAPNLRRAGFGAALKDVLQVAATTDSKTVKRPMTVRFIPRAHGFLNLCCLGSLFSLERKYALVWECSIPAVACLQSAVSLDFFCPYPKNFTKNWNEVGIESPTPPKANQATAAEGLDHVEQILCNFSSSCFVIIYPDTRLQSGKRTVTTGTRMSLEECFQEENKCSQMIPVFFVCVVVLFYYQEQQ